MAACSATFSKKKMDIEDIFLDKTKNFDTIRANMPIYKEMLLGIMTWMKTTLKETPDCDIRGKFNKYYGQMCRRHRIYVKKNLLVFTYRLMLENKEIENDAIMWTLIQKRPARNISGVTVITVLTSPYPNGRDFSCKHNCYYCPNEPDMPRSYLKREPAVARGFRNMWDATAQMLDRMHALSINGHEIDKLEIIIEGGTYTEYPESYLEEFHRDLIYTANTYFDKVKREKKSVKEERLINATAKARIIGICIETRPDALFDDAGVSWLPRFRHWGVTRVQLGVQHTDNFILKRINRGHTIQQAEFAIKYLKDNCFKVDIHLMPDLPNATPEKDRAMFDYVFKSSSLQPDQVKIYPCEVTPWTVIKKWHDSGKYKPYAQTNERALLDVVKYAMEICPPWVRLPRIVRDIPSDYIQGGNKYPNLRQMLNDELKREGKTSMDIRFRECGRHPIYKPEDAILICRPYCSNGAIEQFISFESPDRKCIFGFLRLRIPNREGSGHQEFEVLSPETALIRELHVYGNVVPVGYKKARDSQHKGFGRRMMLLAEQKARERGCSSMAVISGIGVTEYYKKLGYTEIDTFMIKKFDTYDYYDLLIFIVEIVLLIGIVVYLLFVY